MRVRVHAYTVHASCVCDDDMWILGVFQTLLLNFELSDRLDWAGQQAAVISPGTPRFPGDLSSVFRHLTQRSSASHPLVQLHLSVSV